MKWNLSSMYVSTEAWDADVLKFKALLPALGAYRGKLGESGESLLEAFRKFEEVEQLLANLYVYAGLKAREDTRISENGARSSQAGVFYSEFGEHTAYFSPELLAIPERKLFAMVANTPELTIYKHSIEEQIRFRDFTLSEVEEKILAQSTDVMGKFSDVYSALNNADMTFGEIKNEQGELVELTKARYGNFLYSPNRQVRKDA